MNQDKFSKILNINSIYFFYAFLMILLIIDSKKLLDVLYFSVVTIEYIRFKIYRKKVQEHHFR